MKKINVKDLELNIDIINILNLYSTNSKIYIDVDGNIYKSLEEVGKLPLIFKAENFVASSILDAKAIASKLFADYKPNIVGTICKIKPVNNWQNIITFNKDNMLYFDHQSDGVEVFEDKELEDYGWHGSALGLNYREISDFIEENCDGYLVCYDNEIQFSGFVIVENIDDVRKKVKDFIVLEASKNLKNGDLDIDDGDVIDALEFFEIKVD